MINTNLHKLLTQTTNDWNKSNKNKNHISNKNRHDFFHACSNNSVYLKFINDKLDFTINFEDKKIMNKHIFFWFGCMINDDIVYKCIYDYLDYPINICIYNNFQKNIINKMASFCFDVENVLIEYELSPLQNACIQNMYKIVDILVNSSVVDINYYCKGYNALQYMIIYDKFDKDIFELLFNNGINVLQDYTNINNKNNMKHYLYYVDITKNSYINNIKCFDKLLKHMLYSCLINNIIDEYVFNEENIYDLIKNLNKTYIIDDFIHEFSHNLCFVNIDTLINFYSHFMTIEKILDLNINFNCINFDRIYKSNNNFINKCIDYFLSPIFHKNSNEYTISNLCKIFNILDIELIIKNDNDDSFLSSLLFCNNAKFNDDFYISITNKYMEIKEMCANKKSEECKICFNSNISKCKLLPCKHNIICINCVKKIDNICPYCRSTITQYIEFSNNPIFYDKNNNDNDNDNDNGNDVDNDNYSDTSSVDSFDATRYGFIVYDDRFADPDY